MDIGKDKGLEKFLILAVGIVGTFTFFTSAAWCEDVNQASKYIFDLEYKPSGFYVNVPVRLRLQDAHFRNEPNLDERYTLRGALLINEDEQNHISFICDRTSDTLFLDLNRNGDLTDDSKGVFRGRSRSRTRQNFDGISLDVKCDSVWLPVSLVMTMFFRGRPDCYVNSNSGFSGEIELYGRKWFLAVADNLDGKFGRGDYFVLKLQSDSYLEELDLGRGVPGRVFFGGHGYDISLKLKQEENRPVLQAVFTEIRRPMGKLNIEGKFIKRLVLENDSELVFLDSPDTNVTIPTGRYRCIRVYLDGGSAGLFSAGEMFTERSLGEVLVSENEPGILKVGGPLNNDVVIEKNGNVLTLNYKLVDAVGREYQSLRRRLDNPPVFDIYKGQKKIASGKFEYG